MNRIITLALTLSFATFNISAQDNSCTLIGVHQLVENMQLQLDAQQETIETLAFQNMFLFNLNNMQGEQIEVVQDLQQELEYYTANYINSMTPVINTVIEVVEEVWEATYLGYGMIVLDTIGAYGTFAHWEIYDSNDIYSDLVATCLMECPNELPAGFVCLPDPQCGEDYRFRVGMVVDDVWDSLLGD